MPVLDDIRGALREAPAVPKGMRRFVVVGKDTMPALAAGVYHETDKARSEPPTRIGDYPVVQSNDEKLRGWDIVDKPEAFRP